jgi:hypothetical protein
MDEERIEVIARAMCRAARLDPDKPAAEGSCTMMRQDSETSAQLRNWTLFKLQAEAFVATNRDITRG